MENIHILEKKYNKGEKIMKKIGRSIIFGVLCFTLSFAITIQLKVSKSSESKSSQTKITDGLKDQVLSLNDDNNKLSEKLQKTSNELSSIRDKAAENDSSTVELSNLIKKYTILTGRTDVSGKGIVLKYKETNDKYVTDIAKDLREIINEIKNAGAEAISINGQRLVETSSIEMVKNKIEVNGTEISSPFIIKAIGNSELINSGLIRPGGTIELISNAKIDLSIEKNIKIEKYTDF